jgi:ABC-2 type transport system ATP-binding protein
MAGNIIELVDLTKKYGAFTAVDQLNLTIKKGDIFGLLGPNGAGKSTTILMMLGLTEPTSGSVRVCGIDSTTSPIEVKKRVGYLAEDVGFYHNRTGLENLIFTAQLNSIPANEVASKAEQMLQRVGLSEAANKKTGKYSRGMLQRLGLAEVLIKNPEVIILDEPTLGIDPKGVREFLELIVSLSKEDGLTVIFSSHDLHQVQLVCDRVGLFVGGKLIAEGNIQELSQRLFSSGPFTIEAVISYPSDGSHKIISTNTLTEILQHIAGVINVNLKDDKYQLECSRDTTTEVAGKIIESGFGLSYLNKREYGLDDIYYRYFEGGEDHE